GSLGGLALHAVGDGVVDGGDLVPESAVLVLGVRRRPCVKGGGHTGSCLRVYVGDITIAPGRPEAIHSPSIAGQNRSRAGAVFGEVNYFRCNDSPDDSLHPISCDPKRFILQVMMWR